MTRGLGAAWAPFWTSRLLVWAAGVLGVMWFGSVPVAGTFDAVRVTSPFSPFGNLLVAPLARWDSVLYLLIARDGYPPSSEQAALAFNQAKGAYYPLYPLLIHVTSWIVGSPLVAAVLISLGCFLAALVLLHRLAEIELGPLDARGTLLLVAFFPTAFFFSAVYAESLFLALSVGAVLAARQGRWAWAGIAGGLAALTRNTGIVLLVPLLVLFLYGPRADRQATGPGWLALRPRHPLTPEVLWLALVPLGLAIFLGYSAIEFGDALHPFHLERIWGHHFALLGGITGGLRAGVDELRRMVNPAGPAFGSSTNFGQLDIPGQSLLLLGFLAFALVGLVGVLRRLPFAYGAYVAAALAATLSSPVAAQPLASLPRYILVLFPLYMWLARWARERGRLDGTVGMLAATLAVLVAEFARWGFVS